MDVNVVCLVMHFGGTLLSCSFFLFQEAKNSEQAGSNETNNTLRGATTHSCSMALWEKQPTDTTAQNQLDPKLLLLKQLEQALTTNDDIYWQQAPFLSEASQLRPPSFEPPHETNSDAGLGFLQDWPPSQQQPISVLDLCSTFELSTSLQETDQEKQQALWR